ncbi:hypothetical protein OHB12_06665 [Nocardia sp. NBC_01730]|uniref:tetratricopeptide repeat protein n=1 Tax=Nocardia sp. NBC_01730 TaxID=2975998 RepID=UPI002E0EC5BF|nr:hypothetical protein OHB12_06665 [Nocardia sp. NBC_01730]
MAARYQSAEPIVWHGSMVYPMYTEQVGPAPTTVTVTLLSAAPPAGLRGLGMGLSVVDGYVDLHGRSLAGVDAWSDALAAGVSFDVTPTAPGTLVTLTPVWVDEFGTQKSWVGNYGIVIEHRPGGRIVLWCSIGEGPPNFANLVVEVHTAPAVVTPNESIPCAPTTTPIATSTPSTRSPSSAGPPTAPTMPVPRIDAGPPAAGRPPSDPRSATSGDPPVNGQAAQDTPTRRPGTLFTNMQSSRTAQPAADTQRPAPSPQVSDTRTAPASRPQPSEESAADIPRPEADSGQSGDPGYRSALYNLGVAMQSRGEAEQACGLWAQAANAGHAAAAYELGMVRFRRGDPAGAEYWWRAAADRREPRAMAGLAELLDQQGNHDEARAWRTYASEEQAADVVGQPASD